MTRDLQALAQLIGPRFAEGAAERDAGDVFVAEHYDVLKAHKVFSALVPADLGGGGARHSAMCTFLRELAHYCPQRRWRCRCISISWRRPHTITVTAVRGECCAAA